MKILKGILLFLLQLICTLAIQYMLLRLVLAEENPSAGVYLRTVLLCLLFSLADFAGSCFLLKGHSRSRYVNMILQFWDILLCSPFFLLAVVGLISGGTGIGFGLCGLGLELLLVIERSTSYVLFDPGRKK
jgi:hypothetical protein